jgi:hypothetical protein
MTDKAKILEASQKHLKPEGQVYQYGTAGVTIIPNHCGSKAVANIIFFSFA